MRNRHAHDTCRHLRPGHGWVCELGDAGGDKGCIEETFKLPNTRSWKEHKGIRFYDGESALVVRRWFHRTDDDATGCTFVEQDLQRHAAPGAPPVAMLVSSTRLRGIFGSEHFKQIMPPALDLVSARLRRSGAGVNALEGVGKVRFALNADKDSEMRDRTVRAGSILQ